jgi:hypothetical protein
MRPSAILTLNLLGLLVIWGLLDEPHLAALILLASGILIPVGLGYEVHRGHLDHDIAVAATWWSTPFIILLGTYLAGAGTLSSLVAGAAMAVVFHIMRVSQARDTAAELADEGHSEE